MNSVFVLGHEIEELKFKVNFLKNNQEFLAEKRRRHPRRQKICWHKM